MVPVAFAYGVKLAGNLAQSGWVQGLKVAAVAVVAQAVWTMARKLCPDVPRAAIAVASAIALLLVPHAWMQIVVLAAGAVAGLSLARLFKADPAPPSAPVFAGRPWSGLGWQIGRAHV